MADLKGLVIISAMGLMAMGASPAYATPSLTAALELDGAHFAAPVIQVDTGDGANITLARKLQKRLRAQAKARGLDPSKIRVDPATVPYNINSTYAKKQYYQFIGEKSSRRR